MTQQEVADAAGVERVTYAYWEGGKNEMPATKIARVAAALRVPVEYFFDDEALVSSDINDDREVLRYFHGLNADLKPTGKALLRTLFEEQDRRENRGTIGKKAE